MLLIKEQKMRNLWGSILAIGIAWTWQITSASAQSSASIFTTGYRYDATQRLTGTIQPAASGTTGPFLAERSKYDENGRLEKVETGSLGAWQSESIDPFAWVGFTVFQTRELSYDDSGRKIKETVTASGVIQMVTQYSYDNMDRLQCTAVRMNTSVFGSLPSDACALGATGTLGPDRITKNLYNADGEIIQVRRAMGTGLNSEQAYVTYGRWDAATSSVKPGYTLDGKQEYIIDANGNRAKLAYDGFNRQRYWYFPSTTRPSSYNPATPDTATASAGTENANDYEQYGYDANANRTSLRKRSEQDQPVGSQTILYSYDALNRMTFKDIPGSTTSDVYFSYDLRGLQLFARFSSISGQGLDSGYDNIGRLISTSINLGGTSRTLSFQYDSGGNRTRLIYPDSNYVTFDYDNLERMTLIKENGAAIIGTMVYNSKGERNCWYASGNSGCLAPVTNKTGYTYDALSRLASITHDLSGTAQDVTYCLGTISGSCTSSRNPAGQVLARTINNDAYAVRGQYNANRNYMTNGLNQYTVAGATNPLYDLNGNLKFADGTTYAYDIENRLTTASGSTSASLGYDPIGRLNTTASDGVTTRFLYDGDELVAEYDATGAMLKRYVHGPDLDEPLFWYEGSVIGAGNRRTLRADQQGSIVSIANNNGNNININSYDEWGNAGPDNIGRFGYTGQIIIPEVKLNYYKARIYSPRLGRFLQTDLVGYEDQFNLYAYVANDPVNESDPTGNFRGIGCDITGGGGCSEATGLVDTNITALFDQGRSSKRPSVIVQPGLEANAAAAPQSGHSVSSALAVAAGTLVADDVTGIGVADDPVAAALGIAAVGALAVETAIKVHANSHQSQQPTEVYHLLNRSTGAIDKIGCTCNPGSRYSQAWLARNNVIYQTVYRYSSRYYAKVHENIELTHYRIVHGQYPKLNKTSW